MVCGVVVFKPCNEGSCQGVRCRATTAGGAVAGYGVWAVRGP